MRLFETENENLIKLPCKTCDCKRALITISGPHYKATCSECGRFIKFVPKKILKGLGYVGA
jgi:uncharacterized Zn finger protein